MELIINIAWWLFAAVVLVGIVACFAPLAYTLYRRFWHGDLGPSGGHDFKWD